MLIVTGGAGFIGSNIVAALEERGETDIVVVDRLRKRSGRDRHGDYRGDTKIHQCFHYITLPYWVFLFKRRIASAQRPGSASFRFTNAEAHAQRSSKTARESRNTLI